MASTSTVVLDIKKNLLKELDSKQVDSVERCADLLSRLDECDMNIAILSDTLIGTVVSKMKHHESLGPKAKALVKKWKLVAKSESSEKATSSAAGTTNTNNSTTTKGQPKQEVAVKVERQEIPPSPSASASPEQEWAGLPSHRQTICQKLYEFLSTAKPDLINDGVNVEAIDHLVGPRASEIEGAIFKSFYDTKAYSDKARSLAFNLKKNKELCKDVILGSIEAEELVKMSSEQLASQELLKMRAAEAQKLIEASRLDWEQANEDKINEMCGIRGDLLKASLFTCGRCKSTKTTSTQKQTRSADEPMTVFVLCLSCGKRWKC
jgi:transcription elongation factor S-II